jgi:anti-anti-sigma regulatory factor
MPIDYRADGDILIIGNVSGVINDVTTFDAARDLDAMLDLGHRRFVLELSGVGTPGPTGLGLLMTLVRQVRRRGAEVVFSRVGRSTQQAFEEMQLDAHVDLFRTTPEALSFFRRSDRPPGHPDDEV